GGGGGGGGWLGGGGGGRRGGGGSGRLRAGAAGPSYGGSHGHHVDPAQPAVDRGRRHLDGDRLGDRGGDHGHHHHRPAVDAGGVQHRRLHAAAVRLHGGVARRPFRTRGHRHRPARGHWKPDLARARGLVAGARPCRDR